MNNDYRKANEILTNIFDNLSQNLLKDSANITNGWKYVLSSIKSRNNKNIGELLISHTRVVDLKNGILLVETDHPGYIQTLQMYNSYIIRGMNKKYPELEIKTLSFRLKGTNFELKDIKEKTNEEKYTEEEIESKTTIRSDLPEELKMKFEELKKEIKKRHIDQN